ncbi:unnamed protein product, partial [Adineta steineri]
MLIDGLCNFIYNVLAFTMISRLSKLAIIPTDLSIDQQQQHHSSNSSDSSEY